MAFFGLFDKKTCDICGGEIGLLGNRKLDDGNLCKKCAAKLSPFFSERRHSTVEQIREQLDYREANKEQVAAFQTSRILGKNTKVYIDDTLHRFMVTSEKKLDEANPDVIEMSAVTGAMLDVDENRSEIYRKDKDGKSVSYNPPRYEYSYNLNMVIRVNHPYFDEIKFRINPGTIRITQNGGSSFLGITLSDSSKPQDNVEYAECERLGREIIEALTSWKEQQREYAQAQENAAPKAAVVCPYCKATTVPDERGRCEYCGGAIGG